MMGQLRITLYLLYIVFTTLCGVNSLPLEADSHRSDLTLTRIAFGSCNRHDGDQSIWKSINNYQPDLWIWLGDIVYADYRTFLWFHSATSISSVHDKYHHQQTSPLYSALARQTPIVGVWDDHDYGLNNADKTFAGKDDTKQELLKFLEEPPTSPRWQRHGVYASYTFGEPPQMVKVILLDVRYFADRAAEDILGDEQWHWLKNELANSKAQIQQINLIGSGIQILADKPGQEKWRGFRASFIKLFQIIGDLKVPGVILLSGDVHYAQILKTNCSRPYDIHEATSSGLTHAIATQIPFVSKLFWSNVMRAHNQVGDFFLGLNFGGLEIDWKANTITINIHNQTGAAKITHTIKIDSMVAKSDGDDYRPIIITDCEGEIAWWRVLPPKYVFGSVIISVLLLVFCCIRSAFKRGSRSKRD